MSKYFIGACFIALGWLAWQDYAHSAEFSYTRLDFENACQWEPAASEEEAQMGGTAVCRGLELEGVHYPVHFSEGDLRQFLAYGPADDPGAFISGFGQWNSVHTTIEWRHSRGIPYATIHRWFIENINPQTGAADEKSRGQVLAISTVADPRMPTGKRTSCVVGYIDALANSEANATAREIADNIAPRFRCGIDQPKFFGVVGPYAGTPNAVRE